MNSNNQAWQKLVAAARSAPVEAEAAPFGFATRVASLGLASAPSANPWKLLERFAMRGLLAAGAFCVAALLFEYSGWFGEHNDETVAGVDGVSEILEVS